MSLAQSRMSAKQKVIAISVGVILSIVIIFVIAFAGSWSTTKEVDYKTLQNKLGRYFVIPSGLEEDVVGNCLVYFPERESRSSRHDYYTSIKNLNNSTYRNAVKYEMNLQWQGVRANVCGKKTAAGGNFFGSEVVDGVNVYYTHSISKTEIYFSKGDASYTIKTNYSSENIENGISYTRVLFDKVFYG